MKIAVLGAGKTGQAMACYLLSKGHEPVLWNRAGKRVSVIAEKGIDVTGLVQGNFKPAVTDNLLEAVNGADYIFVMTVAGGHKPIAEMLSGNLHQGQRIIIFNGNWGALEFYGVLGKELTEKGCIVSETGGMILLSDSDGPGECYLKQIKNEMPLAAIPPKDTEVVVKEMDGIFPSLSVGQNVLETSINNSNPILHAPITLFNLTRLENGEDYGFYSTAATKMVLAYAEKADAERVAAANAAGVAGQSCLDILNGFWEDKHTNLYDAIKGNDIYTAGKGPKTINYRYITEDIPYGIAPVVRLGRQYGVSMPYLEGMLNIYSLYFNRDFMAEGPEITDTLVKQILDQ